jgi:hypothetical protein
MKKVKLVPSLLRKLIFELLSLDSEENSRLQTKVNQLNALLEDEKSMLLELSWVNWVCRVWKFGCLVKDQVEKLFKYFL